MTTPSIDQASRKLTTSARDAGHGTATLLRDSGYATIGATDAAVAYVRHLGERAGQVRNDLPSFKTLRSPSELTSTLRDLGTTVEERFGALAGRGREVVESLQGSRGTREAVSRTRVARSRVKAAATSVGRAGEAAADAVEEGAAKIGDDAAVDYDALTVDQLRELARERDIQGRSDMNKSDLVAALRKA